MQTSTHTHTPGPWEIEEEPRSLHIVAAGPTDRHIAWIDVRDITVGEAMANARIVKEAPALLNALLDLLDKFTDGRPEMDRATMDELAARARAAIEAATGEDVE